MEYKGCRYCRHFEFGNTCAAFSPSPIPLEIVSGQVKHIKPYADQKNDIAYEPAEGTYNERLTKHFENVPNFSIDRRIGISQRDITTLKVDAIVNAANQSLMSGGGVCGAIHKAAGPALEEACLALKWCEEGEAKITKGYQLPAKWVIHTVGPVWEGGGHGETKMLSKCYRSCLELAVKNGVKSVAFPSISTGTYDFPIDIASRSAMATVTYFLKTHAEIERVIFSCFSEQDFNTYMKVAHIEKINLA